MESRSFQFNLMEIGRAAAWLLQQLPYPAVVALHGQMGAGKTTLVHAICQEIGVTDTVTSPTFSLINEYRRPDGRSIFHIDLYRVKDQEEALQAGMEEVLFSGDLCFVEWPERASGLFPEHTVQASLVINEDQTRTLNLIS